MTTIQGNFAHADAAERAKTALKQAGIVETRIRTWNILNDGGAGQESGSALIPATTVGGLLAGGIGLVAGAGIGAIVDGENEAERSLPPSGVSVVVDIQEDETKIEAILRDAGASNVHKGTTSR